MPRAVLPLQAEARILEYLSTKDFNEDLIVAAASLFFGIRLWIASVLSRLKRRILQGAFSPIITCMFHADNATPMKTKPRGEKGQAMNPDRSCPRSAHQGRAAEGDQVGNTL